MAASTPNKLACLAALALASVAMMTPWCAAQNSPQDYVDLHNAARADVGAGPVSWNDTVAAFARSYAAQRQHDCRLIHSDPRTRPDPYGENLFWGPSFNGAGADHWSASDAVAAWVSEKKLYDHDTSTCGGDTGFWWGCGHYTQVVWRNSTSIGCARVVCDEDRGVFFICNYNPPGNYVGESPY